MNGKNEVILIKKILKLVNDFVEDLAALLKEAGVESDEENAYRVDLHHKRNN